MRKTNSKITKPIGTNSPPVEAVDRYVSKTMRARPEANLSDKAKRAIGPMSLTIAENWDNENSLRRLNTL
jgi:hypothetical protein